MAKRKTKHPNSAPPPIAPTCSCLLLCEDVVVSHGSDKHMLQGVIGQIAVPTLPATIGGYVVYIRLSNVHAKQTVRVKFEHADTGEVLWELAAEVINQLDPLQVHTLIARLGAAKVEHSGRYILSTNFDGVPLAQTPVLINNLSGTSGPGVNP